MIKRHSLFKLRWWRCNLIGVAECPALVLIPAVFPLDYPCPVIFWSLSNIKHFPTVSVDDVFLRIRFIVVQPEPLILGFSFFFGDNSCSVLISFNSEIEVVLFALQVVIRSFLKHSELLVFSSIAFPDDKTASMFSFLGNIDNLTISIDRLNGIIGLSELPIFILYSSEPIKEGHL